MLERESDFGAFEKRAENIPNSKNSVHWFNVYVCYKKCSSVNKQLLCL